MAFSALGVERNCWRVFRFCCFACEAAEISFCKSAGLTTWVCCAIRSEGIRKKATRTEAIKVRTTGRKFNGIARLLESKLSARMGKVYTNQLWNKRHDASRKGLG